MIYCEKLAIGHSTVLFDVPALSLPEGKLIALIGKNGAGKSTWMQTLLGQIAPLAGRCAIDGDDISTIRPPDLARKVAFVSAQFSGIPLVSVREYISLGRLPYTNRLGSLTSADEQLVQDILDTLEINHIAEKDTHLISDGERQIASIGRALAQQTSVLLLDEPTAFLDYPNRHILLQKLKHLAYTRSLCIVFSTHDLELSLRFSDLFLVINVHSRELEAIQATTLDEITQRAFPEIIQNTL